MATEREDLRILREAEEIADGIWKQTTEWNDFARDVIGKQLARAADSIGANIAEAYGRFHYGEKLQFLYYARQLIRDQILAKPRLGASIDARPNCKSVCRAAFPFGPSTQRFREKYQTSTIRRTATIRNSRTRDGICDYT